MLSQKLFNLYKLMSKFLNKYHINKQTLFLNLNIKRLFLRFNKPKYNKFLKSKPNKSLKLKFNNKLFKLKYKNKLFQFMLKV